MNNIIIKSNNLSKSYDDGHAVINVLTGISLDIYQGDSIAIVGPSGSGKSTLLHLLGGLDNPTSGEVFIKGNNWQSLQEKKRCMLRNTELGFVYQFHHLLPEFSALENVAMPLLMRNIKINDVKNRAYKILCSVGLENRVNHKPKELSGGERARVAIARALIHKPSCILADEPTGNLDQHTASQVFNLMLEINQDIKTALVIVTHDKNIASKMQRILTLQIGQLVERE